MAELAHDASGPASSGAAGIGSQQTTLPASSDRGKLRVFISYSRDDLDFADQLAAALDSSGFECLIDREGISGGEDWKRRLGNLISEADTVVFVLSPSSARSETCAWEVKEAARLNKRILPANWRPLEDVNPPPLLRDLNYIFFYKEPKVPGSGFGTGLASLVAALNIDFDWLREHTRYLQRAMEWDKGGRPANRLLSGNDILDAKAWVTRREKSAPEPTTLQLDFIRASEEEAEARLSEKRKQLEAIAAAQAERETALNKAQEALNQAADAQRRREEALKQAAVEQRKRARNRNIAIALSVLATILIPGSMLVYRQAQEAQRQNKRTEIFMNLLDTEFGRKTMEKICEDAIQVTSTLATTSENDKLDSSLSGFWELYNGQMNIIEIHQTRKLGHSDIESSMVRFGDAIKKDEPLPHSILCPYAEAVRNNCIAYLGIKAPESCVLGH